MRVAWVDDEPSIRLIGQRLIERAGGTCVGFEDHASLLASRDGPFDAAVLQPQDDVPADAARVELRRRGVARVLLASANLRADVAEAVAVDLFDGFLGKPFTRAQLLEALGLDTEREEMAS